MSGKKEFREIRLSFPQDKFTKYLESVGLKNESELTDRHSGDIFVKIFEDYQSGKLCLDEFSQMSNKLWWKGIERRDNLKNNDLYNILHLAGELSFYVRKSSNEKVGLIFIGFCERIRKYYQKLTEKG